MTYVTVDPLEPLLGPVAGGEILKIIDGGNALRLGGPEEVILDRVCARQGSVGVSMWTRGLLGAPY
jgi:hypothetical protein